MDSDDIILSLQQVSKIYTSGLIKVTKTTAVNDISFDIKKGEILSLVGESGSGKSTIANMILRILDSTSGRIFVSGTEISEYSLNDYYNQVQMVFQDPFSSFNYFFKVDRVLNQAVDFHFGKKISKGERLKKIQDSLKLVSLNPDEVLGRYPHQLSGGQLQRFLLARILIIEPKILIADEPTSMVDACARAEILNLLKRLRKEIDISIVFITHDIGQAQFISDRVIVMENGFLVEQGPTKQVFLNPQHKYTQNLLASVPSLYRKWNS
ncbi:Trehalose/maltose import ATP-binding protein MalK [Candidatus Lokiarchaeum ossiferum]|uniref:Trehalose/maltose import ATP-binding protein MalK n=1 Tax=Candidatus Lokiarchaeum ossiferum TaxID=2951803 RepID=A0ABY6HRQ7_9ARCH|nr:Trehalose/maltose import ATP-binding protein MalK [Candidatus Lokiarchaeum sp. B-35]